ncbi:ATP-binding protein [uncultured Tateyamaria sp.]|uniref:sensor histidine kinase n=1 Tax=Tateyamaria sp. 1078 TaxID=3417464 RepID=UPI00260558B3|nr:ATP-binding protein [uncultured Tateyamaria sp.]
MTSVARVTEIFDDVRSTERILSVEFMIRFTLVFVACGCGWLLLGLDLLPLWVMAYYACVMLERHVVSLPVGRDPTRAFVRLWLVSFVLASVYAALPVYVWFMDHQVWQFATGVLLTGAALNIFLLRARNWVLGLAYLIPVCGATFIITASFFEAPWGGPFFWSMMVLCTCLAIYFGVCLWEADRANAELKKTRAQFLQAQKVEALGTLTSGVAHDFNNLLSVVQGNLELLQTYPDAPDRGEFLDAALEATRRGAQLTRQLTSYGRKAEMWPKRMAPSEALHGIKKIAKRVLPANIALRLHPSPTDSTILIDETMLQSALLNLVINARDAMPEGGTLRIDVVDPALPPDDLSPVASSGYIAFEVSDTGTGIPDDILAKIRDPFYSTKPKGAGSGLGLPMVCGFAQQSGGDVTITSRVGNGTTVCLILPRAAH